MIKKRIRYTTNQHIKKILFIVVVFFFSIGNATNIATVKNDTLVVDNSKNIRHVNAVKNIKKKYDSSAFDYTEHAIKLNFWERFKLWLSQKIFDFFQMTSIGASRRVVRIILRIIGIGFLLFVLYKVVSYLINEDGNWIFGRKSDKLHLIATDIENDIHQMDFKQLIETSLSKKNYRLAIRYYYLLVLKKLSEKNKIVWDNEKTNYDYYQEINDQTLKEQFQYISYLYDYCWYGEFSIDKQEYETGKKAFNKLIETI